MARAFFVLLPPNFGNAGIFVPSKKNAEGRKNILCNYS